MLPFIDDKWNIGKHDFDNKGRILVLDWKNSNSNKNKKTLMNSGKDWKFVFTMKINFVLF